MTIRYNFHQKASNSYHHEQEQSGKGQFLPHAQRYLEELKDLLCITNWKDIEEPLGTGVLLSLLADPAPLPIE